MVRGPRQRILTTFALVGLAILLWGIGIIGVGQAGEDICLDHPPTEATGYQSEGSLWPPRMTCVYTISDGRTLDVHHRLYATARAAWLVGFPIVAALGISTFARSQERR